MSDQKVACAFEESQRRPWGLASALLVSALGFMDGTIFNIATPAIRDDLDATLVQGLWFSGAYMLALSAQIFVGGALALIARVYPAEIRGRAIGIWAAASAVTTSIGPIVGGRLLSYGSEHAWRLIFAINLPLGALALWMLKFKVGADRPSARVPLDWLGARFVTIALGTGAFALSRMGQENVAVLPFAVV